MNNKIIGKELNSFVDLNHETKTKSVLIMCRNMDAVLKQCPELDVVSSMRSFNIICANVTASEIKVLSQLDSVSSINVNGTKKAL